MAAFVGAPSIERFDLANLLEPLVRCFSPVAMQLVVGDPRVQHRPELTDFAISFWHHAFTCCFFSSGDGRVLQMADQAGAVPRSQEPAPTAKFTTVIRHGRQHRRLPPRRASAA